MTEPKTIRVLVTTEKPKPQTITVQSSTETIQLPTPTMPEGERLEPQCVKLVAALNLLSGIRTVASCGCCSRGEPYYVQFVIERPDDLLPLVSLFRRPSLQGWIVEAGAHGMGPRSALVNPPYELRFYLTYDGHDPKAAHRAAEKLAAAIVKGAR